MQRDEVGEGVEFGFCEFGGGFAGGQLHQRVGACGDTVERGLGHLAEELIGEAFGFYVVVVHALYYLVEDEVGVCLEFV